jgi:hypothetical protein
MTVDASSLVLNMGVRKDLQTETAKEENRHYSSQYSIRPNGKPNDLEECRLLGCYAVWLL